MNRWITIWTFLALNSMPAAGTTWIPALKHSVFELVSPVLPDRKVKYLAKVRSSDLTLEERSAKHLGIGTAYYVGNGVFYSALHVFGTLSSGRANVFLRTSDGKVHSIDKIVKIDSHYDALAFKLKRNLVGVRPLRLNFKSRLGEKVYSVGNALGEGVAIRDGIISGYTSDERKGDFKNITYSAPTSPGNSGGPLLNSRGEVLGTVVAGKQETLNYAVPISLIQKIPEKIKLRYYQGSAFFQETEFVVKSPFYRSAPVAYKTLVLEIKKISRKIGNEVIAKIVKHHDPNKNGVLAKLPEYVYPSDAYLLSSDRNKPVMMPLLDEPDRVDLGSNIRIDIQALDEDQGLFFFEYQNRSLPRNIPEALKKIMDGIIKVHDRRRRYAKVDIGIRSFGIPDKTGVFKDIYGRKWLEATWVVNFDRTAAALYCLPVPIGFSCLYGDVFLESLEVFKKSLKIDNVDVVYSLSRKRKSMDFVFP